MKKNINLIKEDIKNLNSDDKAFEKFVREKYFMKKPKENSICS